MLGYFYKGLNFMTIFMKQPDVRALQYFGITQKFGVKPQDLVIIWYAGRSTVKTILLKNCKC